MSKLEELRIGLIDLDYKYRIDRQALYKKVRVAQLEATPCIIPEGGFKQKLGRMKRNGGCIEIKRGKTGDKMNIKSTKDELTYKVRLRVDGKYLNWGVKEGANLTKALSTFLNTLKPIPLKKGDEISIIFDRAI